MISHAPDDSHCQHLLQGWMKFVAPLTPPSAEGVASLECVKESIEPVEQVPESVFLLLTAIALSETCGSRFSLGVSQLVSKTWPTMWVWMEHIYAVHLRLVHPRMSATRKSLFAKRHQVLVKILRMFVDHGKNPVVSKISTSHPGVVSMMADMWIREGTDKSADNGFRCAVFCKPLDGIKQKVMTQVIAACGTAEAAVNIACQRVERNLGQARREYGMLHMDLSLFALHLCEPSGDSPLAPPMYASPRVASSIMHAWDHSTSDSCLVTDERRGELIYICLTATFLLLQESPQAYHRILDVLHHDLLPLLTKSFGLVRSSSTKYESFTTHAICMLHDILSPATVHRRVMSSMGPGVIAIQERGKVELSGNPTLKEAWLGFTATLGDRERVYKMFKESPTGGPILLCGNENVRAFTHPIQWQYLILLVVLSSQQRRKAPKMFRLQNPAVLQSKVSKGKLACPQRPLQGHEGICERHDILSISCCP